LKLNSPYSVFQFFLDLDSTYVIDSIQMLCRLKFLDWKEKVVRYAANHWTKKMNCEICGLKWERGEICWYARVIRWMNAVDTFFLSLNIILWLWQTNINKLWTNQRWTQTAPFFWVKTRTLIRKGRAFQMFFCFINKILILHFNKSDPFKIKNARCQTSAFETG
jgi:hypothetical protein